MIVPEIRDVLCPDIDVPVRRWKPDDPANVRLLLELTIGASDDPGAALFQIVVATPDGLRRQAAADAPAVISDRALLVVTSFSWPLVERHLQSVVGHCSGWSWEEVENKLRRFFIHEYEGFR